MEYVNIFIAGSQNLREERQVIKLAAQDLNGVNKSRHIFVYTHSYEDFKDNQGEYNNYITNEANIVIFLVDGTLGKITEQEFIKAAKSFNEEGHPEIIVFVQTAKTTESVTKQIQYLIEARLESHYYVPYDSPVKLKEEARKRIELYINNKYPVNVKSQTDICDTADSHKPAPHAPDTTEHKKKKGNCRSRGMKTALCSLIAIIVLLAAFLAFKTFSPSEPLIFAGGGSVKNYIEQRRDIDIAVYSNSIYINLPSGSAWHLMPEEANRYKEYGSNSKGTFTSICLSADEIDSTFIDENNKSIFDDARIIQYKLGYDSLVVYLSRKIAAESGIEPYAATIDINTLKSLVGYAVSNHKRTRMFSTKKTSGTLRLYQSCFAPEDSVDFDELLDNRIAHVYYQNSNADYIKALEESEGNQPYIILGSKYYCPRKLKKDDDYQELVVVDGKMPVVKPLFLYFIARYDSEKGDYCIIRKPIIQFLKKIKARKNLDADVWKQVMEGKVKTNGGDVIINLKTTD